MKPDDQRLLLQNEAEADPPPPYEYPGRTQQNYGQMRARPAYTQNAGGVPGYTQAVGGATTHNQPAGGMHAYAQPVVPAQGRMQPIGGVPAQYAVGAQGFAQPIGNVQGSTQHAGGFQGIVQPTGGTQGFAQPIGGVPAQYTGGTQGFAQPIGGVQGVTQPAGGVQGPERPVVGTIVIRQYICGVVRCTPRRPAIVAQPKPPTHDDYASVAWFTSCLCFFTLVGFPALFLAYQAKSARRRGDLARAKRKGRLSLGLSVTGIMLGIVSLIVGTCILIKMGPHVKY